MQFVSRQTEEGETAPWFKVHTYDRRLVGCIDHGVFRVRAAHQAAPKGLKAGMVLPVVYRKPVLP